MYFDADYGRSLYYNAEADDREGGERGDDREVADPPGAGAEVASDRGATGANEPGAGGEAADPGRARGRRGGGGPAGRRGRGRQ